MLKGRGRDPRGVTSPPAHPMMHSPRLPSPTPGNNMHSPGQLPLTPRHATMRSPGLATRPAQQQRALPARPEPDYEVVEFPSDQYVNAKLQPPPPPPPRPPTGHPVQASCGLCGGGGARVRCAECGRRALCASCDDMYHRHPKRRHHQRQALSLSQLGEDRPPLPPKGTPPVPPPRRHKMSASPMPPMTPILDQRRTTLSHSHATMPGLRTSASPTMQHTQAHQPLHVQTKMVNNPAQMGSMPFLPTTMPHQPPMHMQPTANTLGHLNVGWNRPRGSLQGFPQVPQVQEPWDSPESVPSPAMGQTQWGRPMRRGASTLELGGAAASCAGCALCAPPTWRYGSCAALDQPWGVGQGGWPMQPCCPPQQSPHGHFHMHQHMPQTPQPYRRADSRAMSRAASRAGSRAASPAMSVRSRTSRRNKHRTPSPQLRSSDADSESDSEPAPKPRNEHSNARLEQTSSRSERPSSRSERPSSRTERPSSRAELADEDSLGPIPPPPDAPWQCEHCTYVNEPGIRVCVICCRTPTAAPKVVAEAATNFEKLHITSRSASPAPERVDQERTITKLQKERTSTGCGPSPPLVATASKNITQRLVTPTRDQNGGSSERQTRHDMAVGPSPPRESRPIRNSTAVGSSSHKETHTNHSTNDSTDHRDPIRASPYPETKPKVERHSVSVGPSPPRENTKQESNFTGQKKFVGTSPPRDVRPESRSSSITGKTNVSNTGTSPPPQSISTQTYEDPNSYERAPSATRSRPRRRFRDDRRERSHSRHSLSSDTRESDRSVRTTGAWEWRERDSSPSVGGGGGGEWGGKLARRASHLDVRRRDVRPRRTSLYGSEAASPEPVGSGRATSMEVLSGGRSAERGLELARLLAEAERLGYSAAEVQTALSQCPGSPLAWLRARWAGLVGAVQGAAARLAPRAPALSEAEARAALAAHRGAVWPAVTHCVDNLRRQSERVPVSGEGRMRGRVWGSPTGADDEAAPRREDSSDEYDAPPARYLEEWYPPIDGDVYELDREIDLWNVPVPATPAIPTPLPPLARDSAEVASKLRSLLLEAGIPSIDENLLLKGLLSNGTHTNLNPEPNALSAKPSIDFIQSENDFIDAYNALTRASPLPNISKVDKVSEKEPIGTESKAEKEHIKDDEPRQPNVEDQHKNINIISHHHDKHKSHSFKKQNSHETNRIKSNHVKNVAKEKQRLETGETVQQDQLHSSNNNINHINPEATLAHHANFSPNDIKATLPDLKKVQTTNTEEKANNLNEIVDNTQKLIQQMKEEINSDIHSLDDGHSQTSLSDRDSSSHDEQESSYSESEEETDKMSMTSDEKEISTGSSSEDERDKGKQVPTRGASFVNRTSSEDNEQFEEALDNLDTQIEDVKHANIEILDSIARSLQEEHTISIEVKDPNQSNLEIDNSNSRIIETNEPKNLQINNSRNISIVVDAPKEKHFMREDPNNNIFVEVNSFEEIYDELSTSNVIKKSPPQKNVTNGIQKKTEVTENIPIEPIIRPTKYAINESVFKVVSPTRVIILDNQEPIYNAILEDVEIINEETVESATELIHDVVDVDTDNVFVNIDVQEIIHSESVNNLNTLSPEIFNNAITTTATETVSNGDINTVDESSILVEAPVSHEDVTIDQQNEDLTQTQITSVQPIPSEIIIKQDTPERILVNPTSSGNKSSNTVKSNIPKPIRSTPNNKKNDKTAPKLLVSKVPVRRGSLKQHHAPAPPKAHFGNVQSGHVKQLQSKIFNSKDIPPAKPPRTEIEVKPSTSTASLTKKSPAPQPPKKQEQNQSAAETSPPEEKSNNYFRETCRTEDEWTESDSDESQTLRQTSVEVKPATPEPPPPITLRKVSGNIIDLAKVRLPEGSPERQARMLLAEGATETWAQAQLAVQLTGSGDATLACALLAALQCADLPAALAYLHQECELCAERRPQHEMVSMLRCSHRCCRECARLYFTVQVTERSILDCVCPFCKLPEPEALPEDAWLEYFAHLDIQLKTLLDTDVHELFQRKLRDRTLAMDPNFKWCMECSSGFFVHPKQKKLRCPECRSVTCATCRKAWSQNHEGLSCEQYAAWLADNDPEISVAAVQQHLRENGLECPRCHFKYSLSRGGCMHFTCTQCKYEFCYGCGKPFTMGARCGLSDYCAKLGLHAHHPRNCLFYLRDKEPHELQTLLQMNNVAYEVETSESTNGRCPIPLQRETPTGLVDGICGSEVPPKHAGMCKPHYVEYLAGCARPLDPIPIMQVSELVAELRRRALPLPERGPWDSDPIYAGMCAEIVKEKIPLD